jgi:hypothetical protein
MEEYKRAEKEQEFLLLGSTVGVSSSNAVATMNRT